MRSLFLLMCLIVAGIWGFWNDQKDGWEYSIRLKSRNEVIVTSSDVMGVMGLTAAAILGSILRWKQVQAIIEKLADVRQHLHNTIIAINTALRLREM